MSSPIGLFGGTFDPPHKGHLSVALSVFETLELTEIRFIPCAQPLLREPPIASAEHRMAMLEAMIQPYSHFKVDDIEIKRGGNSYTVNTVKEIREKIIEKDTPICFIMSTDQFMQFDRWYQWERILDFVHLVVTDRKDHQFKLNQVLNNLIRDRGNIHKLCDNKRLLREAPAGSILFELEAIPLVSISSTEIRAALRENSGFLPPQVWKYICEHKLYTST